MFAVGTICFTVGVILINVKLLVLELHSKTVITFGGFIISLGGWFLWNVALSGVYPSTFAIYNVRNSFVDNFGRRLLWWSTLLLSLVTPIIIELVVQSIRRVYWPNDQDLMQRIEQDSDSKRLLQQVAQDAEMQNNLEAETVAGAVVSGVEGIDGRGRDTLILPITSREQSKSPAPPRAGQQDPGRRSVRASHDEYRRPQSTPRAEERGDPFSDLRTRLEHIRDE
jgi:phospholipid-translocating ATPase